MQELRANTAVDVLIGPFLDSTDGVTAETALTISQADVRLSKNGQDIAQKNDSTAATHDELGYYNCELDATDTNTLGTLVLAVAESGALPVRHEFMVLTEEAWDAKYLSGGMGVTRGQASAVAAGSITLEAGFSADELNGATVYIVSASTGAGQSRVIHDFGAAANRADISPNWTTTPTGTVEYLIIPTAPANQSEPIEVNVTQVGGVAQDLPTATALATVDANVDAILVDTGTTLPASLTAIETDTQDIQSRLPASLNNGAIPADVQRINDVEVTGDGTSGTEWGPA